MDLDNKYALGEVAANDSESKTFRARDMATGREVLVHILFGGKPAGGGESLLSMLLQRMVDPAPEKRAQIVEVSDYKGMPYAVTGILEGFTGMRAWIEAQRAAESGPQPAELDRTSKAGFWRVPEARPAVPAPAPGTGADDDFDRLFGSATGAPAPPPPQPASPTPAGQGRGEFTSLFRATVGDRDAPVAPAPSAPPPPVAPPAAPQPAPPSQAGEFTRMFQASPVVEPTPVNPVAPPARVAPPPPAPPAPAAGEFTRMFQASPVVEPAPATPVAPPPRVAPPPPPAPAAGEFT
ncbi:MAG TPA: hypothetical protein VFQ39_20175, partial [Longimicrobium sp.]|nr:hypothetical protein [Longimicrobium sp.]